MRRRKGGFFVFAVVFVVSMFIYAGDVSGGGEKKKGVLFSESYEDGDLHGRGWYDGRKFKITEKDSYAGKGCIEYHWEADGTIPESSSGSRRLFEPTEVVYLRFYMRLSEGWGWSGRSYHPHMIDFLTTENSKYHGPARSHLTLCVEPVNGKLRLAAADIQNNSAPHGPTQGELKGGYNGKSYESKEALFDDAEWHCVEAMFKMNSLDIENDRPNSDGELRGWFDNELVIEDTDVIFRSTDFPEMKFNQLLVVPYFGPGLLPHAQTLWLDELAVGTERIGPLEETAAAGKSGAGSGKMKWTHFAIANPLPGSGYGTGSIGLADFDGDGDLDITLSRRSELTAYWYERESDSVWIRHEMGKSEHLARALGAEAVDVDRDGLVDSVINNVWFKNPGNLDKSPDTPWPISKYDSGGYHDVIAEDINGDGCPDILTYGAHSKDRDVLAWFDTSRDLMRVVISEGFEHHGGIAPKGSGDLDGDGDNDVVVPGYWFENSGDGRGKWERHEWPYEPIPNATYGVSSRSWIADIDEDGENDIIFSDCDTRNSHVYWCRNTGRGRGWVRQMLPDPPTRDGDVEGTGSFHSLGVADFDNDGDLDIFAGEQEDATMDGYAPRLSMKPAGLKERGVIWLNSGEKKPTFTAYVIHVDNPGWHDARLGDVDGDGDIDIVSKVWNKDGEHYHADYWRNDTEQTGPLKAASHKLKWTHLSSMNGDIGSAGVGRQAASLILDIDKDGVNDFVIAGWSDETSMVWFRHTSDGWKRYLIDNRKSHIEAGGAYYDIDGDGDTDILQGGSWVTNEVWWWENPYPDYEANRPWKRYTIKDWGEKQHHDQIFGDFDGDGKGELVFWNQTARKLFIADIPEEPKAKESWAFTEILSWPSEFKYEGFDKADVDMDGKTDLIGGGMWFKHTGGKNFDARTVDSNYGMSRSAAGDLIKGGRPEIVMNSGDGVGPLNLYECKGGKWVKHTLIERVDHGHTLQVGDMNGDGNLDIYAAEMYRPGAGENCKQWVLYGDGRGGFAGQLICTGIGTHEGRIGDLDGDGDLDILQKDFQEQQRVDVWLNDGAYKAKE